MTIVEIMILGVMGGISPGPITALMLGETFKRGFKSGAKVPLALIVSNILVGGASVALFSMGKDLTGVLHTFTYFGAMILIWMGIHEFRASGKLKLKTASRPFQKALLIELCNVHPYLFWFGVLAPAIVLGGAELLSAWSAFTAGLVLTKLLIVFLADVIREHLKEAHILWVNRVLAVALIGFGLKLLF